MSARPGSTGAQPSLQRIAAPEVDAFIRLRKEQAQDRALAQSELSKAREQARQETDRVREETAALEKRLEAEAEELAERSALKLKAKQDAILAETAMAQVSAIARDYAELEPWLTRTIMSAVSSILKDVPPNDRWSGLIKSCLDQTSERWGLSLMCHPNDFDTLDALVSKVPFKGSISKLVRDETASPGVCYLKGNKDFFELDLQAQVVALEARIAAHAANPAPRNEEASA
ncbi:MAG: hypothetical protein QNJ44_21470 [Rhodobacter sp.]|nr:hypothetical protein [Rhodobacter sp.]